MFCKAITNKRYWLLVLAVGIVSLAFGVIGILLEPEAEGNGAMLLGMFTGMGGALTVLSIVRLIYLAVAPAARLREQEIKLRDERTVTILRASYTVANTAATLMFAVMAFVFVWLGYRVPAYISVAALWVQLAVFMIAQRVISKKM